MKISACVIVKNEEHNMGRWLASVKKLADEIIVVDTGSNDGTVALATEAGAVVKSFDWCNDFAAAKNYALEQATGDWICFLDADEFFSDEAIPKIRPFLENAEKKLHAQVVTGPIINIDPGDGNRVISRDLVQRVFRNLPYLKYKGMVHEYLDAGEHTKSLVNVLCSDMVIYHTGYATAVMAEKGRRNLAMLQEEERLHGVDPKRAVYFSDCYYGLGDMENAIRYAQKALLVPKEERLLPAEEFYVYVGALEALNRLDEEYSDVLEQATTTYPEIPIFWARLGLQERRQKRHTRAKKHLEQALVCLLKSKEASVNTRVQKNESDLPRALHCLVQYYLWQRESSQAVKCIMSVLQAMPRERTFLRTLLQLLRNKPSKKVLKYLDKIYNRERDADFLLSELRNTPFYEAIRYYAAVAPLTKERSAAKLQELYPAEQFLLQEDYKSADNILRREIPAVLDLAVLTACEMDIAEQDAITRSAVPEEWQRAWQLLRQGAGTLSDEHCCAIGDLQHRVLRNAPWQRNLLAIETASQGNVQDMLKQLKSLLGKNK